MTIPDLVKEGFLHYYELLVKSKYNHIRKFKLTDITLDITRRLQQSSCLMLNVLTKSAQ